MPDQLDSASSVLNATVIERRDLTDTLSIIRIRSDSGEVPPFEPGQFIVVALPSVEPRRSEMQAVGASSGEIRPNLRSRPGRVRLVRRAYSIASAPSVRDHVELFLVLVQQGKLTPRLWDIQEGGRVWLDNKCSGEFVLPPADQTADKDLVMIATGTGVAPYLSMLREYAGTGRWRRFVLIHGARYAADLGYRDELEALTRQDPSVLYLPTITREPQESVWTGMRGRVQQALTPEVYERLVGRPLDPVHSEVFLCGNPAMIEDVAKQLEPLGFVQQTRTQPGNLHYERYW